MTACSATLLSSSGASLALPYSPQVASGTVNSYTSDKGPIEPEARRLLMDLYRPYNSLLAKITGEPRFEEWNKQ